MLSVDEARQRILRDLLPLPAEELVLAECLGRVPANDLFASIDLPPFANSAMDGFALRSADLRNTGAGTPTQLDVVMDIPAGAAPRVALGPGQAARIMTGAPLPAGADAVVPVEQTDADWSAAENSAPEPRVMVMSQVAPGDHVRPVGENVRAGQRVVLAGTSLRPQHLGLLAALGQARLAVRRRPRVAIVSTGDELVEVHEPLTPGLIHDSNSVTIQGMVSEAGGIPLRLPIARDNPAAIRKLFHDALQLDPDLIISTAGVSVGAHDVVRDVLEELGELNFWRVNMRPGKPLAWGQVRGVPFFGLPGNPVSAMVTFEIFVRPALTRLAGRSEDARVQRATICEDMRSDGRRSYLRVTLRREEGRLLARATGTQSSGALLSMVLADGLLIVPEGVCFVPAGSELDVQLLR